MSDDRDQASEPFVEILERTLSVLADEARFRCLISWASPVLSFGGAQSSTLATLGLNPSNREFVDAEGNELLGTQRRFHTLGSLGIDSWFELPSEKYPEILDSFEEYFQGNPYDRWFKVLNELIGDTGFSYYDSENTACHLDLIPYATHEKWGELSAGIRTALAEQSAKTLGELLAASRIRILILNGRSVVEAFQKFASVKLDVKEKPEWNLPRKRGNDVPGVAYTGQIHSFANITLCRPIFVAGYNHNIQSSFGVTTEVRESIRGWLGAATKEYLS